MPPSTGEHTKDILYIDYLEKKNESLTKALSQVVKAYERDFGKHNCTEVEKAKSILNEKDKHNESK